MKMVLSADFIITMILKINIQVQSCLHVCVDTHNMQYNTNIISYCFFTVKSVTEVLQ